MKLFATLTSGQTSSSFQVTHLDPEHPTNITLIGNFNSVSIHMETSPDNSTFTDLYADASLVEFTTTGEQHSLALSPGYYRFVASTVTSVAIYVDGRYARF